MKKVIEFLKKIWPFVWSHKRQILGLVMVVVGAYAAWQFCWKGIAGIVLIIVGTFLLARRKKDAPAALAAPAEPAAAPPTA